MIILLWQALSLEAVLYSHTCVGMLYYYSLAKLIRLDLLLSTTFSWLIYVKNTRLVFGYKISVLFTAMEKI